MIFGAVLSWAILAYRPNTAKPEIEENAISFNALDYTPKTPPSAIEEIEKRPLFQPTRLPEATSSAAPSPDITGPGNTAPDPGNVVLLGTIIDSGNRVVLVKSGNENVSRTLREGEMLNGWKIESIQKKSISLRNGDQHREINFP